MKRWMPAALCAALAITLLLAALPGRAVPTAGWGLSFQTEGQAPAGPVRPEKLRELGAAYVDEDGGKVL